MAAAASFATSLDDVVEEGVPATTFPNGGGLFAILPTSKCKGDICRNHSIRHENVPSLHLHGSGDLHIWHRNHRIGNPLRVRSVLK